MRKDYSIYLDNVLECIMHIEKYAAGLTKAQFLKNDVIQDAVMRRIGIIGKLLIEYRMTFKKNMPLFLGERSSLCEMS